MRTRFIQTLKEYIEKEGLTNHKFADMVGIKLSTFYDFLRSDDIMLRNVLKIVDYLGASLDYFEGKTKNFYCDYKKDYKVDLQAQVKKYLKEKNIPLYRMCDEIGMSRTNYFRWRDGDCPKYYSIVQMANYFGVSIDEFIGRV
ncbi:MAG: XRE family transcriptional regulator [Clostridiales bacterium]|nr:XRE family transcriptional regulator [Clostridiales bacterium]